MAIEDVIYAKNRDFYGGFEPSNMKSFNIYVNAGSVEITATLPTDTIIDGQTLCSVAGARIMRKVGGYPQTENDGELVADIKDNSKLQLEKDNKDWYYAAFPYSTRGVFNRSPKNRPSMTYNDDYFFGYDVDMTDPNPETRVSYPDDVDNRNYDRAFMDFDNDRFDYGGWPNTGGTYFMPCPAIINLATNEVLFVAEGYNDGYDLDKYINPDTTYDVAVNGNYPSYDVFMRWPKIYYRRWIDGDIYHFRCSNKKVDSNYECWQNYDINDKEIPYFYISAFPLAGPDLDRSGSGLMYSSTNMSYMRILDAFEKKHYESGVYNFCYSDEALLLDLYTMMVKTTNLSRDTTGSQANYGIIPTGLINNRGLFYGQKYESGKSYPYKIFGIENLFTFKPLVGLNRYNRQLYYKITPGLKDGSKIRGYYDYSFIENQPYSESPFFVPETSPIFNYLNTEKLGLIWPELRHNGWATCYYTKAIVNDGLFLPGNDENGSFTTYYCGYCYMHDSLQDNDSTSLLIGALTISTAYYYRFETPGGYSKYDILLSYKPLSK